MKRGQTVISVIFTLGVFVFFWIFFLSGILSEAGRQYIEVNGSSGLEALFYANLNGVVFLVLLIVIGAFTAFGGSR